MHAFSSWKVTQKSLLISRLVYLWYPWIVYLKGLPCFVLKFGCWKAVDLLTPKHENYLTAACFCQILMRGFARSVQIEDIERFLHGHDYDRTSLNVFLRWLSIRLLKYRWCSIFFLCFCPDDDEFPVLADREKLSTIPSKWLQCDFVQGLRRWMHSSPRIRHFALTTKFRLWFSSSEYMPPLGGPKKNYMPLPCFTVTKWSFGFR